MPSRLSTVVRDYMVSDIDNDHEESLTIVNSDNRAQAKLKIQLSLVHGVRTIIQEILNYEEESPLAKSMAGAIDADLETLEDHLAFQANNGSSPDYWVTKTVEHITFIRDGLVSAVNLGGRVATLAERLTRVIESFR